MPTTNRRPLSTRTLPLQDFRSASLLAKRPRSPDHAGETPETVKRVRAAPAEATHGEDRKDKERRRVEREAQKAEFRLKYTRAFPGWVFYFDLDLLDPESAALRDSLAARVMHLKSQVDDFFSNEITHLITNQPVTPIDPTANKENRLQGFAARAGSLKSPIKLRGRTTEDATSQSFNLVEKAKAFNMKIWSPAKLDSILERCDVPAFAFCSTKPPAQTTSLAPASNKRSLSSLLQTERLHGTTTERDPTQKRHDYRYFSKQSYFVLIEDVRQELATIHALEYPIQRGCDGKEQPAYPVLYCDPRSRGPFVKFDERERRRWEKAQKAERENENERAEKVARALKRKRQAEVQMLSRKTGDLRRSVSMNNLHRQAVDATMEEYVDLDGDYADGDTRESATASGYLASTGVGSYVAASGNSVGITSTRGTTSNASGAFRTLELPASLRCRIQQQVVTSRKAPNTTHTLGRKAGGMGPPLTIPDRPNGPLRKSRSTNTLRLPKRDEGSKPGYCESCRVKFDDFDTHTQERRHRKFALDNANYVQLDSVLNRVRRRTREEAEEERTWSECGYNGLSRSSEVPETLQCSQPSQDDDESMWDEEDAEGEVDLDL
ncbi:Dfp1/Him1, central region-domain-containing protein [Suillus paluster]|uniref:Dfp1/Him1, central region-domain-containing protein n=1 Tax=Suillus paluster TaxID=48578 RepID=UPI001B8617FB|nr:Dfp1/Him1, central region-domain-containing protein [Suillus paluster]KAG1735089.1 Dfp1/Him1, central region-domain-containing protein [Suillus paluster]